MAKTQNDAKSSVSAQPRLHQRAREIQPFGTVSHALPLELEVLADGVVQQSHGLA